MQLIKTKVKSIPGYENYLISEYGTILSKNIYEVLKIRIDRTGYYSVVLSKKSIRKHFRVHRLVGFTYLSDSYFEGAVINHKDRNKLNNHVSNLEWCTIAENNKHARETKPYNK